MKIHQLIVAAVLLASAHTAHAAAGPFSAVQPPEFNAQMTQLEITPDGFPTAWYAVKDESKPNVKVLSEGGQKFLRLTGEGTRIGSVLQTPVAGRIPPTVITFRARLSGFQPGRNNTLPNLVVEYLDGGNGISTSTTAWIADTPNTDGWTPIKTSITARNDHRLRFIFNFDGKSGHLDIADFKVELQEAQIDRSKIHPLDDIDPMFGQSETRRVVDPSRIAGAGAIDESKFAATLYVNPSHSAANDLNSGTDAARPKKTIAAAVAEAQQVYNEWRGRGIRIVLAAGVHRLTQPIVIDNWRYAARHVPLIFEGDKNGGTVIAGSVTEGFEPSTWKLVDKKRGIYRHDWQHNWGLVDRGYYTSPNIVTHRRELIALNGKLLRPRILEAYDYVDARGRQYNEVALLIAEGKPAGKPGYTYKGFVGLDKLEPGEFGVAELGPGETSYQAHAYPNSIFFRLPQGVASLNRATIEVGMAPTLLRAYDHHNMVLRNLTFKHAAGWYLNYPDTAAVEIQYDPNMFGIAIANNLVPKNVRVENCKFVDNLSRGLAIFADGYEIRNSEFRNNGRDGLNVEGRNAIIENVVVTENNRLGYIGGNKATPHGGGGISMALFDALFKNVKANRNYGTALRGDVVATNVIFDTCQFNYNVGSGQMQEISWGPILYKNTEVIGNRGDGLLFYNVWDMTLENSVVAYNGRRQISVAHDTGRDTAPTYHAFLSRAEARNDEDRRRSRIPTSRNLVLRNTIVAANGDEPQLIAYHGANQDAYRNFIKTEITGSGNRYWAPTSSAFNTKSGFDRGSFVDFETWKQATGQDKNSVWEKPSFMAPAFTLPPVP